MKNKKSLAPKVSYTNRKVLATDFPTPETTPTQGLKLTFEESLNPQPEPKKRKGRNDKGSKRASYNFSDDMPEKYRSYVKRAVAKKMRMDLSVKEFYDILAMPCHYCGDEDSNTIDRSDSKRGYEKNNVVPCCFQCNMMKNMFSTHKFLSQVDKIYKFQNMDVD